MKCIVAALTLLASSIAYAGPEELETGNDFYSLYKTWQSESASNIDREIAKSLIYGYTKAVIDTYSMMGSICPPEGSTYSQAIDVVAESLRTNPAERNRSLIYLSPKALNAAFKCEK